MTYTTHRDTQATLQILDRAEMDASECTDVELYKRFGLDEKYEDNELSCWQRVRPKIWATFEVPHSSLAAKHETNGREHVELDDLISYYLVIPTVRPLFNGQLFPPDSAVCTF
ncbi:unnamed protein product [Mesocestoides corti]|uniref:Uncharacterized protein n=1 Tax=Mesocestoides corti TaxID=53468 RepID=A0A0R3U978_MESCO|nr:unnamed protein product [Mesocestoides corti]